MKNFEFTISNGVVTAIEVVEGDRSQYLRLPKDAVFTVGSGVITETITGRGETQNLTFTQIAGSDLYSLSSVTRTISNPSVYAPSGAERGLSFTITDGAVTAVQEEITVGGRTTIRDIKLAPTESFTIDKDVVTETRLRDNAIETITFVKPAGEDLYAVSAISSTFIAAGDATTLLSVHDRNQISATVTAGTVTAVAKVEGVGDPMRASGASKASYAQPEAGFIVETITRGTRTAYEVYFDGNGDGIYTEVAHGAGAVDLVGLKAQLDQIDSFQSLL